MFDDIQKYLRNPGCACNLPLYKKILSECSDQLIAYYPNSDISVVEEEPSQLVVNKFNVINCSIGDLESKLRNLGVGRKQIAISRFQDQVTVIINELDVIY